MFNVGAAELLVLGVVALLVLGPDKLPEAARKVGQVVSEIRKVSSGFQAELRDALQEPVDTPPLRRDPTPKATPAPAPAAPPVDPDEGTAAGTAIDPADWYGGTGSTDAAEPLEPSDAAPEQPPGPHVDGAAPDGDRAR